MKWDWLIWVPEPWSLRLFEIAISSSNPLDSIPIRECWWVWKEVLAPINFWSEAICGDLNSICIGGSCKGSSFGQPPKPRPIILLCVSFFMRCPFIPPPSVKVILGFGAVATVALIRPLHSNILIKFLKETLTLFLCDSIASCRTWLFQIVVNSTTVSNTFRNKWILIELLLRCLFLLKIKVVRRGALRVHFCVHNSSDLRILSIFSGTSDFWSCLYKATSAVW